GEGGRGRARLADPAEQVHRALVEPEVVHLRGHLAVLDEVDAIPGQTGQQERLRIHLPDVPQTGEKQTSLRACDQIVQTRLRSFDLEDEVPDVRRGREARGLRRM